jgi:hypothetical protein
MKMSLPESPRTVSFDALARRYGPSSELRTGLRPTLEDEIHMIVFTGVLDAFFYKRREFILLLGGAMAA